MRKKRSIDSKLNKIIQGDCIDVMKTIPSESVDVVFADPPFNLKKKYTKYDDEKQIEDYIKWCHEWLNQMVRVLKPTGSLFVHNIPKWLTYYSAHLNKIASFRHWISWDSGGIPLGKTLLPNHYGFLYYTQSKKGYKFFDIRAPHKKCRSCGEYLKDYGGKKSQMHPFGYLLSDVWTDIHRIRHKKRRDDHPCQLPIPILERLILMSSDPGDIVLDPFIGTGTTAIAAKQLGRKYIGIDIDPFYVAITNEKLTTAFEIKIDDIFVSLYLNTLRTIRDVDYETLMKSTNSKPAFLKKVEEETPQLSLLA